MYVYGVYQHLNNHHVKQGYPLRVKHAVVRLHWQLLDHADFDAPVEMLCCKQIKNKTYENNTCNHGICSTYKHTQDIFADY